MPQKDKDNFAIKLYYEILACSFTGRRVVTGVLYSHIDVQLVECCISRKMPVY
jgi:hypothetical protein